eukprot:TRINITY_DN21662_c0_g1_i1.p1 TRINITY_DN21662_c0_g1~~TRINITY_DN21662_c0_g1_i1.p1  ORF type:complete len:505 (+),score=63.26 TRINITY_DN21662_c0_g1_i1:83-1597(+)
MASRCGLAILVLKLAIVRQNSGVVAAPLHSSAIPSEAGPASVDPRLRRALSEASDAARAGDHHVRTASVVYDSMPKNEHGRLTPESVMYIMDRVLSQQSGLSLDTGNASTHPLTFLVRERLERVGGGLGYSLSDVVGMVATLESLVDVYLRWLLNLAYDESGVQVKGRPLNFAELMQVMEMYVVGYLHGHTASAGIQKVAEGSTVGLMWAAVKQSLDRVSRIGLPDASTAEYGFETVWALAKEATVEVAHVKQAECSRIEGVLLDLEEEQTGRLHLADFQQLVANEDTRHLGRTIEHMRSDGILDESDKRQPKVIISNYMASRSHCIAKSGLTCICCPTACMHVLNQIEESVGRDAVAPADIVHIVEELPVLLPGVQDDLLSPSLMRKLNDQARLHGGRVSIHGESFSHWLHLLSPRSCAFPTAAVNAHHTQSCDESQPQEISGRLAVEEKIFDRELISPASHVTSAPETKAINTLYSVLVVASVAVLAVGLRDRSSRGSRKLS